MKPPAFPLPSGAAALCPSVLSADFACLEGALAPVRRGSDWIHLDVMDGVFVPNISFGPHIGEAVARVSRLPVDAHLMVAEPLKFIEPFAKSGAGLITVHAEARGAAACLKKIKSLGLQAGLSLRPRTPASRLARLLPQADLVLVMTVEPGFGGQAFMEDMLPKVARVRALLKAARRRAWLQVDGGINAATAPRARAAGADAFVVGSALFKASSPGGFLAGLRRAL
jgi:ribulose-phosphate 3-epimerase